MFGNCVLFVRAYGNYKNSQWANFFFFFKKKLPTVCGGFSYLNFLRDHNGKSANCFCIQQGDFDNKQNPKFAKSLT